MFNAIDNDYIFFNEHYEVVAYRCISCKQKRKIRNASYNLINYNKPICQDCLPMVKGGRREKLQYLIDNNDLDINKIIDLLDFNYMLDGIYTNSISKNEIADLFLNIKNMDARLVPVHNEWGMGELKCYKNRDCECIAEKLVLSSTDPYNNKLENEYEIIIPLCDCDIFHVGIL